MLDDKWTNWGKAVFHGQIVRNGGLNLSEWAYAELQMNINLYFNITYFMNIVFIDQRF